MIRFDVICAKVAAAVMAICNLVMTSCGGMEPAVITSVSAQYSEVPAQRGSIFVTVECGGDWTLSLDGEGKEITWAELSKTAGSGNSIVQLKYEENESESARHLTIVVNSASQWSSFMVSQLPAGNKPSTDGSSNEISWMELPSMDNRTLDYFTHKFTYPNDKKTYRNYTLGWSQEDLVALWVAYPLCKFYTHKIVDRTNAWAYDPLLGPSLSSAPFAGYGGNYARGHQLPSADRLCCTEANMQTFYGTNLTPQQNEHNEGIWQALESKVRTIANNSDTTYVVTGCMVENPRGVTTDSDGKKMTVPSHYFKALLRYSKASTLTQWSAAAFYLEHKNYSKGSSGYDFKSVSMSIDELEDKTGLDFFVNLPAVIGEDAAAKLEAQDPVNSAVWW